MTVSVITLGIFILSIDNNNGATTISTVTFVTINTLIGDSYIIIIIVRRTIATLSITLSKMTFSVITLSLFTTQYS